MNTMMRLSLCASLALVSLSLCAPVQAQQATMTFFITSAGLGAVRSSKEASSTVATKGVKSGAPKRLLIGVS
jgi:hypothetical protein